MARTIITRDPTHDAATATGSDETSAILDDLAEKIGECGELSGAASTAHASLVSIIKLQREVATKVDTLIRGEAITLADARNAIRESTPTTGPSYADRESEVRSKQAAFDASYIKRIKEKLMRDPKLAERAAKVAERAADELRAFEHACASKRDALLAPRMDYTIEQIMNQEAAKTQWRARGPNMLSDLQSYYTADHRTDEERVQIEPVIVALATEVRDTPRMTLAARRGNAQPRATDEDRTLAFSLLALVERVRAQRLPMWLHTAEYLSAQLRGVWLLCAGHHARFAESFDSYMRRRASGATSDPYAIDPAWPFRLHPSTFDAKRAR